MSLQVEEQTADYTGMITEIDYQEYIRFDGTDQDAILPMLVESSIRQAEAYCNSTFGLKTFKALFEVDECKHTLNLPFAPILSVESVYYVDLEGVESLLTLNTDYYIRGLGRKYLILNTARYGGSILVNYTAGNATPANVNPQVKKGILTILSEAFEVRGNSIIAASVSIVSQNSKVELSHFRNNVI